MHVNCGKQMRMITANVNNVIRVRAIKIMEIMLSGCHFDASSVQERTHKPNELNLLTRDLGMVVLM